MENDMGIGEEIRKIQEYLNQLQPGNTSISFTELILVKSLIVFPPLNLPFCFRPIYSCTPLVSQHLQRCSTSTTAASFLYFPSL